MDFTWTKDEQSFRREVKEFIQSNLPPDWKERASDVEGEDDRESFEREFAGKMGERGYFAISWPKEYGGLGWTPMQQIIFNEEMALAKAPRSFMGAGVYQVSGMMAHHGTDEQKKQFMPPIARGEVRWCTLFSEPNAGSDLASVQTTAIEDGDFFVVNGEKVWTTNGHKAQHGLLLARTNPDAPKHKGLSYLLVDMSWPGVTITPIINMADVHHFNSVHLDNVRVPKDRLVGEKDQGWYVTMTHLSAERSGIRSHVPAQQLYEELVGFVHELSEADGYNPLAVNPRIRHKLAQIAVELEVSRTLAYRVGWMQSQGQVVGYPSPLSKLFSTELTQRLVGLAMEVLGLYSQVAEGPAALLSGKIQKLYRGQRAITLGAGTSEIQRNIIARRGLGLGRGS